jgi:hypothetical protein
MCTVPRKNGPFRDSAHKGLQLLQENYMNTHTHILYSFNTATNIAINTSNCVLKVCTVVQLHAALAMYS